MEALKYKTIIKKDGEINLNGVPFKKGQQVEMIILINSKRDDKKDYRLRFDAIQLMTTGFKFSREEANER